VTEAFDPKAVENKNHDGKLRANGNGFCLSLAVAVNQLEAK